MAKQSNSEKIKLFLELAKPDNEGVSRWVSTSEFVGKYADLQLGNGFSWGRKGSGLAKKYVIETVKSNTRGTPIEQIRLNGLNTKKQFSQAIRKDIKDALKNRPCVMLGTYGGKSENMKIEIDHKDGRKDDMRVSDIGSQAIDDFQPLCKAANDFKRQKCKECKETNKRWNAETLEGYEGFPFYDGDEDYKGTCVGCYLYDPVAYRKAFRRYVKEQH